MEYSKAIVREPGSKYADCISSHPLHHTISLELSRKQHKKYCEALESLGIEVLYAPRDDDHPDSCFVEDNAIVQNGKALICRMAKESRRGEQNKIEEILQNFMPTKWAEDPATIEGGDIVHNEKGLIAGISKRTNRIGVKQMREWLDIPVRTIEAPDIMHLKSYVTYLGNGVMMATERFASHPAISDFRVISPPKNEEYAADTLAIGNNILMAEGYPKTQQLIRDEGFDVIPIEISEIKKCDGAISCLSIPF